MSEIILGNGVGIGFGGFTGTLQYNEGMSFPGMPVWSDFGRSVNPISSRRGR
jgi:hypothetical protein